MLSVICEGGLVIRGMHLECAKCWTGLMAILGLGGELSRVTELLPSGEGEAHELTGNGKPTRTSIPDDSRLAFLRGLPVQVVQTVGAVWGKYEAFVFRTPSGKVVAFVEAPLTKNALYVLDAGQPTWLEAAQADKGAVRQRPEFIGRIVHLGAWQTRVRRLLELE